MNKVAIMNAAREKYRLQHLEDVKKKAREDFKLFKNDVLFVSGVMLYWAEGRKATDKGCELGLSNADPKLLKVYCNFLRKYFNISTNQLRARVFLYPDLDKEIVHKFWSEVLNVPRKQFIKHTLLDSRSKQTENRLPYGTCCVYVHSKDMCVAMQTWIGQFADILRG